MGTWLHISCPCVLACANKRYFQFIFPFRQQIRIFLCFCAPRARHLSLQDDHPSELARSSLKETASALVCLCILPILSHIFQGAYDFDDILKDNFLLLYISKQHNGILPYVPRSVAQNHARHHRAQTRDAFSIPRSRGAAIIFATGCGTHFGLRLGLVSLSLFCDGMSTTTASSVTNTGI